MRKPDPSLWAALREQIPTLPESCEGSFPIQGGCIHTACRMSTPEGDLFVKTAPEETLDLFRLEAAALNELREAAGASVVVPRTLGLGATEDGRAFLCLEHLSLRRGRTQDFGELGRGLAHLHRRCSPNNQHGWWSDNVIGATPQPNPWTQDWAAFFVQHRLKWQFDLAAKKGLQFARSGVLLDEVAAMLANHHALPSLLHGDLWSGNIAFIEPGGQPAIFDPACYFGDRETDIAFTSLFGGFPAEFYAAYNEAWPLSTGFQKRALAYKLYHVLNHFNLFGAPYDKQASTLIDRLLSGH